MEYKGWHIERGEIELPHGITVKGWMLSNGVRKTIADSKELAMRFIDNQEDRK